MSSYRTLCRIRMAAGQCVSCGRTKEPERAEKWRCQACVRRYSSAVLEGRKPTHYRRALAPTPYAAVIPCLKCGEPLQSPDRRLIRFHDACRYEINRICDEMASPEMLFV